MVVRGLATPAAIGVVALVAGSAAAAALVGVRADGSARDASGPLPVFDVDSVAVPREAAGLNLIDTENHHGSSASAWYQNEDETAFARVGLSIDPADGDISQHVGTYGLAADDIAVLEEAVAASVEGSAPTSSVVAFEDAPASGADDAVTADQVSHTLNEDSVTSSESAAKGVFVTFGIERGRDPQVCVSSQEYEANDFAASCTSLIGQGEDVAILTAEFSVRGSYVIATPNVLSVVFEGNSTSHLSLIARAAMTDGTVVAHVFYMHDNPRLGENSRILATANNGHTSTMELG